MIGFQEDLASTLNRHSAEAPSGTPDFILAEFLTETLKAFNEAVSKRGEWRGQPVEFVVQPNLSPSELTSYDPFDIAAEAETKDEDPLASVVFQALGAASVCWDEDRVFDSQAAQEIGDRLVAWINNQYRSK